MNLILFTRAETARPLPLHDPRAEHLLTVLRRRTGDSFDAGILNGPRGKGTLAAITADHLDLTFIWSEDPPPEDPLTLIIGLPRPQTARKILQEAAALGVAAIHFTRTERGEPSYADSTLWSSGEWERHVQAGAAQAFCTRVPLVTHDHTLETALHDSSIAPGTLRIALDNYEAAGALSQCPVTTGTPVAAAFGSERGWSAEERVLLRQTGFSLAHLGTRVLRLETAVVAAVSIIKSRRGLI